MNHSQLKQIYDGAKNVGAKGMLLIKWVPGDDSKDQYIHLNSIPLDKAAEQAFQQVLKSRNAPLASEDKIDSRQFERGIPTMSDFGLETVTYTKNCCIFG